MTSLRDFIAAYRHSRRHGNSRSHAVLYAYGYAKGWRQLRRTTEPR